MENKSLNKHPSEEEESGENIQLCVDEWYDLIINQTPDNNTPHGHFEKDECKVYIALGAECGFYWDCYIECKDSSCKIRQEIKQLSSTEEREDRNEKQVLVPYLQLLHDNGYKFAGWNTKEYLIKRLESTQEKSLPDPNDQEYYYISTAMDKKATDC